MDEERDRRSRKTGPTGGYASETVSEISIIPKKIVPPTKATLQLPTVNNNSSATLAAEEELRRKQLEKKIQKQNLKAKRAKGPFNEFCVVSDLNLSIRSLTAPNDENTKAAMTILKSVSFTIPR